MSGNRLFGTHRSWEDWLGMLLGVLIMVSPWFPMQVSNAIDLEHSHLVLNSFVVGMLVLGLAQLEYVALHRWEEVASILLGLWLIASPFVLSYSQDQALQLWHIALGALVAVMGALALWQDWNLSEQELAEHSH
ncbi:SPW repeat protein [Bradyrhizobium genosp. L]|uniref:SPW repeat protein n=1 Tax=Bradyrhizobium genosp. L TaxID=83637 RepID=UPI0018A31FCA|nr:SPW repeat protein [Bradyrhizobium genosp. L]QPF81915.1 SPW repeat protein [Bradyrhizobium genosp. L]